VLGIELVFAHEPYLWSKFPSGVLAGSKFQVHGSRL
jgi:hypothetical protein